MKKLLLTAAAILATLNMYGQGQGVIGFSNAGQPNDRRVWVNTTGVVGDGALAAGTGYKVALYYGSRGTAEQGLVQIGNSAAFNTPLGAGIFSGGNRTLTYANSTVNGDVATVQVRGWGTIAGVPDTYEAVKALGDAGDPRAQIGSSLVFDADTSRPGDAQDPPVAIGARPEWRGFAISPVPEPSVIGLGLLGVGTLLMLRRRK